MPPSHAQYKTVFGHEDRTIFWITGKDRFGKVRWKAYFEDREDFDIFLHSVVTGNIKYDKFIWKLPTPEWSPDFGTELTFEFASQSILTATTNTTWTLPTDWNNADNKIECLGGSGGSGGIGTTTGNIAGGGGGGAYSRTVNATVSSNQTYNAGIAGTAGATGSGQVAGTGGTASFGTICVAVGGTGGTYGGGGAGGTGGAAASGTGTVRYSGGNGGAGAGGGGAAGPSGNGAAPVSTTGGTADNGTVAGGTSGNNGNNGTQFSASYGCGSGAGSPTSSTARTGGNYGGGPAGRRSAGTTTVGVAGVQGLVVVTYTPLLPSPTNMPMLGM